MGYCQPLAARAPQASHQRPGQRTDSPPAFPLHLGFGEAPRDETAFLPLTNLPSLSLSPLCAKSPSSREASGSTWRPALGEDLACASLLSTVGVRRTQVRDAAGGGARGRRSDDPGEGPLPSRGEMPFAQGPLKA